MPDVFDMVTETAEEAANLRARAKIMSEIVDVVSRRGWSQRRVAQETGLTPPRVNDLVHGKLSKFSLDALFNIAAKLGTTPTIVFNIPGVT